VAEAYVALLKPAAHAEYLRTRCPPVNAGSDSPKMQSLSASQVHGKHSKDDIQPGRTMNTLTSSAEGGSPLSEAEHRFLQHMTTFGSDGYPIRKYGRVWIWEDCFGVKGPNTVYKTKSKGHSAIDRYLEILCDKKAGRL
jgi:hypothetical protein